MAQILTSADFLTTYLEKTIKNIYLNKKDKKQTLQLYLPI